jgi:hypothetical protein
MKSDNPAAAGGGKPKRKRRRGPRVAAIDLYLIADRLPAPGERPADEGGGPNRTIELLNARMIPVPTWGVGGAEIFLAIDHPIRHRFMWMTLSVAEAKKLRKALDIALAIEAETSASLKRKARG